MRASTTRSGWFAAVMPPSARGWRYRQGVVLTRVALIAGMLLWWEGATRLGWWDVRSLSAPSLILVKLAQWTVSGVLWPHVLRTLQEALSGFALGLVVAVVVGFILGRRRFLGAVCDPILAALNAVPRIVLAPLLILWFGIGPASKVALSALMTFFVVIFAVLNGIREVDRALVNNVLLLGASQRQLDRYVYLPAALTWIFGSLRLALGFSFTAAIVGEILLSSRGLGYLMNAAQNAFDVTSLAAALVALMIIISLLNVLAGLIERRVIPWKTAMRQGERG